MKELPNTFQTPTMAPFCKDEEKYKVVDDMVKEVQRLQKDDTKIDGQIISEVLTVNWGKIFFRRWLLGFN